MDALLFLRYDTREQLDIGFWLSHPTLTALCTVALTLLQTFGLWSDEDAAKAVRACGAVHSRSTQVNLQAMVKSSLSQSRRLYQSLEDRLALSSTEVCGPVGADRELCGAEDLLSMSMSTESSVSTARQRRAEI
jgi:hypothetical protein